MEQGKSRYDKAYSKRRWGHGVVVAATLALAGCGPTVEPEAESPGSVTGALGVRTLNRPSDPVVLLGSSLGPLVGIPPGDLVAFRYSGGAWAQIPVQVDERGNYTVQNCYNGAYNPLPITEYTDSNTWVGADANSALDGDDEVVFMAFDTGDQTTAARPAGVVAGSGVEITVTDPLNNSKGWVYLFRRSSTALDPAAGKKYVDYQFRFGAGYTNGPAQYKSSYNLQGGVPEDSLITGLDSAGQPVYRTHFSMKWVRDNLQISKGGASGVDILDVDQAEWAGGTCSRHVGTFSNAESCFSINKSGPVRALRQYFGANSGNSMQRTHEFYQSMEVVRVNYRLHDGVGIQAYMDHNANAYGMRYFNDRTTAGVPVDGNADNVQSMTRWAMLSGSTSGGNQGSYSVHLSWRTNLPDLIAQGVYDDNSVDSRTFSNCYGTTAAISIAGSQFLSGYCTDPYAGQNSCSGGWFFIPSLRLYYEGSGMTVTQAEQRDSWVRNPLTSSAAAVSL